MISFFGSMSWIQLCKNYSEIREYWRVIVRQTWYQTKCLKAASCLPNFNYHFKMKLFQNETQKNYFEFSFEFFVRVPSPGCPNPTYPSSLVFQSFKKAQKIHKFLSYTT